MFMRVGVVGVGAMGEHHARIYSQLDGCEVVGVMDVDPARAKMIAQKYSARAFDSFEGLLNEKPDAVSIVVPTSLHREVASKFLERGISCLVEKPIASSLEDAKAMISLAERMGATLMVGHIERFNPAVLKLKEVVREGRLGKMLLLSARRVGPFAPRIRDVGIIVDSATHDIDVIRYLTEEEPRQVKAVSGNFKHAKEDYAIIIMEFSQTIASIEVNWFTPIKTRTLIATGTEGTANMNYIDQTIELYDSVGKTQVEVAKEEPLKVELSHFIECVRTKRKPLVDGTDGMRNLEIALNATSGQK
jgi:UDP-N-acetylglucosamine 3-dehydrogenase